MGLKARIENNALTWFLGAIVTGFGAGIGAYQGILEIAKLEVVSQERRTDYEALRTKDQFLSLYLRYALSHLPPFQFEHTDEQRRAARDRLNNYMLDYIEAADKAESLVRVGKGHGTQTTITFPDGSQWIVPPSFEAATAN